jgi:hypothetical protein
MTGSCELCDGFSAYAHGTAGDDGNALFLHHVPLTD